MTVRRYVELVVAPLVLFTLLFLCGFLVLGAQIRTLRNDVGALARLEEAERTFVLEQCQQDGDIGKSRPQSCADLEAAFPSGSDHF